MKWRKTLLIILIPLISISLFAQNEKIDKLWEAYKLAKNDLDRVSYLNRISEAYEDTDFNEGLAIAYQAAELAIKIDDISGLFDSYTSLGLYHDYLGNLDSSYYYYDQSYEIGVTLNSTYLIAIAKNNLGIYHVFRGNYALALQYLQEALSYDEEPGYNMDPIITYSNIGLIYEEFGDNEKAVEYYQKAGEIALASEEENSLAFAKITFGYIAYMEERYEEALHDFQVALDSYTALGWKNRVAETIFYMGMVYKDQNKFEIALQTLQEALTIYEEQNSVLDIPSMYYFIAQTHEKAGDRDKALEYYYEGIRLAEEVESPADLTVIYEELAKSYASNQDYEQAYKYQVMFRELEDSLYSKETRERIDQLETNYKLKIKTAENAKLIAEQAKKEAILRQRTTFAFGASLIALLVGGIAFVYYRANREKRIHNQNLEKEVAIRTAEFLNANTRLLESNEELERFTYIASHDLKEPLRNITSFVNLIQRKLKGFQDEDLHEYMDFVTTNTKQMYELLNDILAFSRITATEESKYELVNTNQLIKEIQSGLKTMLEEKNGHIRTSHLPSFKAPKAQLFLVLKNVIENGLKYNESSKAIIDIGCTRLDGFYLFKVKDNGIGVAAKYHDQIFEMFKRLNNRDIYVGSGIGLATCKKIVSKYDGRIWIESEEGKGSCFYFTFPANLGTSDDQYTGTKLSEIKEIAS